MLQIWDSSEQFETSLFGVGAPNIAHTLTDLALNEPHKVWFFCPNVQPTITAFRFDSNPVNTDKYTVVAYLVGLPGNLVAKCDMLTKAWLMHHLVKIVTQNASISPSLLRIAQNMCEVHAHLGIHIVGTKHITGSKRELCILEIAMANNLSSCNAASKFLDLTQTQGCDSSKEFLIFGDVPVRFQLEQKQSKGKK